MVKCHLATILSALYESMNKKKEKGDKEDIKLWLA